MFKKRLVSRGLFFWLPLILLPIIFWQCYFYVGFNQNIVKFILFATAFILLMSFANNILNASRYKNHYDRYVAYSVILFLLSIFTAFIYWGQNPILTFRAGVSTLVVLYFFQLKRKKVTLQDIVKIVFFLAFLYIILWGYAISQMPKVVFGNLNEVDVSRGFLRVSLNSLDVVCLLYFIALVNIFQGKKKVIWTIIAVISFIVIFLSLSRMIAAASLLVTLLFFLKKRSFVLIILVLFLGFGGNHLLRQNEIVDGMIRMTENQVSSGDESNLRFAEYKGAFELFPFRLGTFLFGNGSPHVQSSYGQYEESLKNKYGFNRSDGGYPGTYVTYGLFMLVLLIRLFIKVLRQKVTMQYMPYKLFVIFLFITNLTSSNFWSFGISFMISLYALELAKKEAICINN